MLLLPHNFHVIILVPCSAHFLDYVAQLVEQRIHKPQVVGSSPPIVTLYIV